MRARYRYGPVRFHGLTTAELIVEERPWRPRSAPRREDAPVRIRVAGGELELARQVQAAGGTWNRQRRVWELP